MFETLVLARTAAAHKVETVALVGSPKNKVESWGVPGTLDMSGRKPWPSLHRGGRLWESSVRPAIILSHPRAVTQ